MPAVYEGLGSEAIVDLVASTMIVKYADALAYQQARGDAYDQQRAEALGIEWTQLVLDEVPVANIHAGVLPSFVQTEDREDRYPLVAVEPNRITQDPEDALMDQIGVVRNFVTIHVFARAETTEDAWRKAIRMADAAYQVMSSPPLRGKTNRKTPDNVAFSAPWKFYANGGDHGRELWWFAIGTDYQIKNYIRPPEEV